MWEARCGPTAVSQDDLGGRAALALPQPQVRCSCGRPEAGRPRCRRMTSAVAPLRRSHNCEFGACVGGPRRADCCFAGWPPRSRRFGAPTTAGSVLVWEARCGPTAVSQDDLGGRAALALPQPQVRCSCGRPDAGRPRCRRMTSAVAPLRRSHNCGFGARVGGPMRADRGIAG